MTSASNIFEPASAKFDQVCKAIEADPNYRIVTSKFDLMDLIKKNRHAQHETVVICVNPDFETDSQRVYNILKTAFHVNDDHQTSKSVFDAVITPKKKILVSKKDGTVHIVHGLYGLPGCGHMSAPLTDCKLQDFLNQPCVLPNVIAPNSNVAKKVS